jgi:hypothetical protein
MGWRETTNLNVNEQSALANMTEEELIEAIEEHMARRIRHYPPVGAEQPVHPTLDHGALGRRV